MVEETIRVVIADQDEAFLKSTAELLSEKGYECEVVDNAGAVKRVFTGGTASLLIAGSEMTGNEQLQLISEARNHIDAIPVILVTENPSLESAMKSIDLQVSAYLVKPIDHRQLLDNVSRAIERFQVLHRVVEYRRRLLQWNRQLKQHDLRSYSLPKQKTDQSVAFFHAATLDHIKECLANLQLINDVLLIGQDHGGAVLSKLVVATMETIEALKATKTTFRSKELGSLRRHLERLLGELRDSPTQNTTDRQVEDDK
ncbi:response regulator [bacterium]|nr:response regulator [bacterium]